jgi:hypothetical protein
MAFSDKRSVLDGANDGTAFLTASTLLSGYEHSLTALVLVDSAESLASLPLRRANPDHDYPSRESAKSCIRRQAYYSLKYRAIKCGTGYDQRARQQCGGFSISGCGCGALCQTRYRCWNKPFKFVSESVDSNLSKDRKLSCRNNCVAGAQDVHDWWGQPGKSTC